MISSRRQTLQAAGGIGLYGALVAIGVAPASDAIAQEKFNSAAFQAKSVADTIKALGATGSPTSSEIAIVAPDIAENGAVVPVGIKSSLPKTEFVALLVDKNPFPLAGAYDILPGAQAEVNMRIKMGQSSDVYAIVRADGKYYMAKKEIKVTLGGCGG
ncbi:MAG: thiosulfate oxidation carrier protein SoxY [Burkholderiaceae bacterium]|nr:thiosulfate oxidation carrier protein SoxY [Burkholderiaceae bacterium]